MYLFEMNKVKISQILYIFRVLNSFSFWTFFSKSKFIFKQIAIKIWASQQNINLINAFEDYFKLKEKIFQAMENGYHGKFVLYDCSLINFILKNV